ncbi:hypothetical protein [Prochlorococcus sp. MIT 9401]|uniref:hypothetical protein n=1 Tax=Prochlorococcus sp. MIT 9401 TaxID=3082530 RepID=UPI0039B5ED10
MFLFLFIPFSHRYILDMPNERSSHVKSTPSGGGIIFILIILLFSIITKDYKWLLTIPLALIGFFDDAFKLSYKFKLFFQIVFSILIFYFNNNLFLNNEYQFFIILGFLFFALTIVNYINFMDGIDGLICGSFLVITIKFCVTNHYPAYFLIPCLISLLIFNWSPAKLFLGDTGSLFLGGAFLIMLLNQPNISEAIKFLFLLTPFILDCTFTIIGRAFNHQNILLPHKLHLYQRLYQSGLSHSKISLIYIGSVSLLCINPIYNNIIHLAFVSLIILLLGFFLNAKVAKEFKK